MKSDCHLSSLLPHQNVFDLWYEFKLVHIIPYNFQKSYNYGVNKNEPNISWSAAFCAFFPSKYTVHLA